MSGLASFLRGSSLGSALLSAPLTWLEGAHTLGFFFLIWAVVAGEVARMVEARRFG